MILVPTFTKPSKQIKNIDTCDVGIDVRRFFSKDLDTILNGSQKGMLYLIEKLPTVVTTTFLVTLVHNILLQSKPSIKAAIFLLNQPARFFLEGLMSCATEIWLEKFIGSRMEDQDWERTKQEGMNRLLSTQLLLEDEASMSGADIVRKCEELIRRNGPDIVFIDNLQQINDQKGFNTDKEISSVMRYLSELARTNNTPIAILSQSNSVFISEPGEVQMHTLSDIQKTRTAWQEADEVLIPSRVEYTDYIDPERDESLQDDTFIYFIKKHIKLMDSLRKSAQSYVSEYEKY